MRKLAILLISAILVMSASVGFSGCGANGNQGESGKQTGTVSSPAEGGQNENKASDNESVSVSAVSAENGTGENEVSSESQYNTETPGQATAQTENTPERSRNEDGETIEVDDFSTEDASSALRYFLNNNENLMIDYVDSITVQDYGTNVDYYRFDVGMVTDNAREHIDYYYVIKSRFGGGIYDSKSFEEKFGLSSGTEESKSEESIEVKEFTAQDARQTLLYFINDNTVNAEYVGTVTVEDNGTELNYFKFDVFRENDAGNSHIDYYYVINSRAGGGMYDSKSFEEKFGVQ